MTFIGMDPGKSGGIAWIRDGVAFAEKMPETPQDIWNLLRDIVREDRAVSAQLEQVGAFPGQGVTSCFTFGNGFGWLEMALTGWEIPFDRVRPERWQKALGCLTGGNKNVSKKRAQELFPKLKITHATADALLLAEYARRKSV